MATRSAVEFGRSSGFLSRKSFAGGDWNLVAPHISLFRAVANKKLLNFKQQNFLKTQANLFDMKNVPLQSEAAWKSLQSFSSHLFQPHKGMQ